ncbi:hypothetical protein K492DRAFT_159115 [Lichtheimia hyalospora FSU 10163]|nr:hypothetical protein K492DRAFT_159115 [Lichtheimia hyalospora FSU 10163]
MDPQASQAYTSMMKFTMDGRPYIKDIHDLFGALMVQISIGTHRYLFRNYHNTFTSEDAIQTLGSLRFSHTVRVPDPNDPSRFLRTTTTTTFNMARDMAKALCQQFVWARLFENAVDTQARSFRDRGMWQLTPKGVYLVHDFCQRTEIAAEITNKLHDTAGFQLVRIERNSDDDQMVLSRATMGLLFRIMLSSLSMHGERRSNNSNITPASSTGPKRTESMSSASSSTSSGSGFQAPFSMSSQTSSVISDRLLDGNLLASATLAVRRTNKHIAGGNNKMRFLFSSQMCCDWLTETCTLANRDEAEEIANGLLKYGWIEFQNESKHQQAINAYKSQMLRVTANGKQIVQQFDTCGICVESDGSVLLERNAMRQGSICSTTSSTAAASTAATALANQDAQYGRLKQILDDPHLRSLFKDFLSANFCEENLDFWIDYTTLRRKCRNQSPAMPSQNQRDLLDDAYSLWKMYLAPHATSELNVDHTLRQEMDRLVTTMESKGSIGHHIHSNTAHLHAATPSQSLRMMLKWFDRVEEHILRLMASDSVPKFVKTPVYQKAITSKDLYLTAVPSVPPSTNTTNTEGTVA